MRAIDGLQTTITLGSVKPDGQAFSLELSLEMSLPMPRQDEHLPDQIERGGAGLGFWFFVESLGSMSSTGEMSRRLRIKFEGAIYHVMASASPSPTGR